tara:strand:- start:55 stop:264 length:210 start_codon:yes stop_codon:yes gene_type:complete
MLDYPIVKVYIKNINERYKMNNTEEQIIILAQINTLKEMQIFCLKKEKQLQEELKRLKNLEEERKQTIK